MKKLFDLLKRSQKLNESKILNQIFESKDLQEKIIDLNKHQMYDLGINSKGESLGEYSAVSVEKYGKPAGHIRLFDTGNFYKSEKFKNEKDGFRLKADSIKEDLSTGNLGISVNPFTGQRNEKIQADTVDLQEAYDKPIGLTTESLGQVGKLVLPEVIKKTREQIIG